MKKTFASLALSAAALVVFSVPGFCAPQPPQGHHPAPGVHANKPVNFNNNHQFTQNKQNFPPGPNKFTAQKPPKFNDKKLSKHDKKVFQANNKYKGPVKPNNKIANHPPKYNDWNRPGNHYGHNNGFNGKHKTSRYGVNRYNHPYKHHASNKHNYRYM